MWLLVLNESAGKGQALNRLRKFELLCSGNNISYRKINEQSQSQTQDQISISLQTQPISTIIAFGGDGLVSICLQSIALKNIGLMVVPCGTGNDFSRSIGVLGSSEQEIFDLITKNQSQVIDAAKAKYHNGEKWYLQIMSTGFDASVNSLANRIKWPSGRVRYTIAMLIILFKFKPIQYEITFNNEKKIVHAMLALVANGVSYGGGMKISPHSSYIDGELDLLYVQAVSRLTLLSIFPRVFSGTHINHPKVKVFRSNEFTLNAKTKAYADGELISDLPINVIVVPKAIKTWIQG
jgi:diacylglycerol kinase (ATP)